MQAHKWDAVRGKKNKKNTKEVASKSVFVPKAGEMNGDLLCLRGGKRAFFDIIKPTGGKSALPRRTAIHTSLSAWDF